LVQVGITSASALLKHQQNWFPLAAAYSCSWNFSWKVRNVKKHIFLKK